MITNEWNSYLKTVPSENQSLYATEEYCKLYDDTHNRSKCFIYQEEMKTFLFPFLSREVELLPGYYDFESHYGYGGPITSSDDKEFLKRAWLEFQRELKDKNYIAGFIRFNPVTKNIIQAAEPVNTFFDRHTVAIDLKEKEEEIWSKQIHAKHRNVIRKAEANGLEFTADTEWKYFDDFIRLYEATMKRLNAADFYMFTAEYYKKLKNTLTENSFLAVIKYNERVISAAIMMYDDEYAHYHLSGSDKEFIHMYPNNLMLYKSALYLKNAGKKLFHLGGGTTSSEKDSLYQFKKRFNKSDSLDFHLGKLMINEDKYREVVENWTRRNPDSPYGKLFLKYRYTEGKN